MRARGACACTNQDQHMGGTSHRPCQHSRMGGTSHLREGEKGYHHREPPRVLPLLLFATAAIACRGPAAQATLVTPSRPPRGWNSFDVQVFGSGQNSQLPMLYRSVPCCPVEMHTIFGDRPLAG